GCKVKRGRFAGSARVRILANMAIADALNLHPPISFLWMLPFLAMLLAIATAPFIHKKWWEKYYPLVVVILGAIASWYYVFGAGLMQRWAQGMEDYLSFIVLLASLYIISGGIVIKVTRKATPTVNCILLLTGAVI